MFSAKSNRPHKELAIHVILVALLGVLWLWPWIYQTGYNLKQLSKEYRRTPAGQLLLFIFIPFYSQYWFYKSGQIISDYAQRRGLQVYIGGLCCILSMFSAPIASIVMQMEMNKIEDFEKERAEKRANEDKEEKSPEKAAPTVNKPLSVDTKPKASASPVTPAPAKETAAPKEKPKPMVQNEITLQSAIEYAMLFQTDDGAKRDMLLQVSKLKPEEQERINAIAHLDAASFRKALKEIAEELRTAPAE